MTGQITLPTPQLTFVTIFSHRASMDVGQGITSLPPLSGLGELAEAAAIQRASCVCFIIVARYKYRFCINHLNPRLEGS